MAKQGHYLINTKHLDKNKLYQSFCHPSPPHSKIMLTDLCPSQKAKIGNLMRTLQARKQQNLLMEQKMQQMQNQQQLFKQKIQKMQITLSQAQTRELKYKQEIQQLLIKQQQKQKYIKHLQSQNKQKIKKLQTLKQQLKIIPCVDQFALTDPKITNNQSCQTSQKKKKFKEKSVQYQSTFQTVLQGKKYAKNTQQFQNVMNYKNRNGWACDDKQEYSPPKSKESGRFTDFIDNNYIQKQKKRGNSLTVGNGHENHKKRQQNLRYKAQCQQELAVQQGDEHYKEIEGHSSELAKKWIQLKRKSMQKKKQSANSQKQRIDNERHLPHNESNKNSIQNRSKQVSQRVIPKQPVPIPLNFNITQEIQEEQDNFMDENFTPEIKNSIQDHQSFGPRPKTQSINAYTDQNFDDLQFNKILKDKKFSAKKLFNSKNHQLFMKSQIKAQAQPYLELVENRKIKRNPIMKNAQNSRKLMKKNNQQSNQESHKIDLYELDLVDVVTSQNKPSDIDRQ